MSRWIARRGCDIFTRRISFPYPHSLVTLSFSPTEITFYVELIFLRAHIKRYITIIYYLKNKKNKNNYLSFILKVLITIVIFN